MKSCYFTEIRKPTKNRKWLNNLKTVHGFGVSSENNLTSKPKIMFLHPWLVTVLKDLAAVFIHIYLFQTHSCPRTEGGTRRCVHTCSCCWAYRNRTQSRSFSATFLWNNVSQSSGSFLSACLRLWTQLCKNKNRESKEEKKGKVCEADVFKAKLTLNSVWCKSRFVCLISLTWLQLVAVEGKQAWTGNGRNGLHLGRLPASVLLYLKRKQMKHFQS